MSKRIKQEYNSRNVQTFTSGQPRGKLPNFDVSIVSYNKDQHLPTELRLDFFQGGKRRRQSFDGRQARTLFEVLSRHFNQID